MSSLNDGDISWDKLGRNKLIGHHPMGFSIIKPLSHEDGHIPLDCPVCTHMMTTQFDVYSFNEYECCNRCMLTWAQARKVKWIEGGWRPSAEMVQEELHKRSKLPTYQVGLG